MRLLLGNLISLCAAFFLCASSFSHDRRRVYLLLCGESLMLAAAQAVFSKPIGVAVQLVAAGRNLLVARGRFGGREAALFSFLTLLFGLFADPALFRGDAHMPYLILNILPVLAGIQLTLTSCFCRTLRGARLGDLSNAVIWTVYSVYVRDLVTAVSGACILPLNVCSFLGKRLKNRGKSPKS